jgi:hypothetical protein
MDSKDVRTGIDFLKSVKNDFQFDKNDPSYLGFLNCGEDITDDPGYMIVVNNQDVFEPIMEIMGIDTESGIHAEETVFVLHHSSLHHQ